MRRTDLSALLLGAVLLLTGFSGIDGDGRVPLRLDDESLPLYYVIERTTTVFRSPDQSKPYLELMRREPVYLVEENGSWSRVRTRDGSEGYVPKEAISNVWIRVSKRKQELYVYRGMDLLATFPADFGFNAMSNKERRGSFSTPDHWRTPEGSFYVVGKNGRSKYYKAFVLNYPTAQDAERGYREGLITSREREAIVRAERNAEMPPMNTALGGWIEIHGNGTGQQDNWTQGCVAVRNLHMDLMWSVVHVGTPVFIES